MPLAVRARIAQVPQVTLLLLGLDLQVAHGGLEHRIPVHQALAPVDQALLVQAHEGLGHRLAQPFVHGEALARPVHAAAHAAHLAGDVAAGFGLPLPDLVDECLAAQVVPRLPLGHELAFHHHLRGNAGVVGAGLPQGVVAPHAVVAGQRIHDGVLEGVAHVQAARHIRRRDDNAVVVAVGVDLGVEMAGLFPALVPAGFDLGGVVGFVHIGSSRLRCHPRAGGEPVATMNPLGSRRSLSSTAIGGGNDGSMGSTLANLVCFQGVAAVAVEGITLAGQGLVVLAATDDLDHPLEARKA